MAAYAALSSLSETIEEELLHKITIQKTTEGDDGADRRSSRNLLIQRLEIEIKSLRENTDFLRCVLEKSLTHPLEAQMKDAAEQAQVSIERFVLDQLPLGLTVDDDAMLQSLSHQLQRINDDLISPAVEKINNHNTSDETDEESVGIFDSCSSRETPLANERLIIGMDETIERLTHIVLDESSAKLRVVSIAGMGGIGKTTLARWFSNDHIALEEFEVIGWVTVSRDFSAGDILASLKDSIQQFIRQPKQRNESIENYVHNNLKGKRFLIVLDDVWSPEALRLLMRTFPDDGNGSVILITTRHEEVAAANPKHIIMMGLLDEDDSYRLLVHEVFHKEDCPPELTDLVWSLTRICGGLPLAIILIAGILLASNGSLHEWNYVYQKLSSGDRRYRHKMVDNILSLSYKHLSHRLRSCLLYMGAFPEDRQISFARLTKRLSAQGFLHRPTSHEVEQCVQCLVSRNLVSVLSLKSDFKRIHSVCLHDMVRDFCLKKAQEEKFLHCVTDDDSGRDLAGSKIKVSFNLDNLKRICNSNEADDRTHTIMCFGRGRTPSRPLASMGRFKLLKSLDLANVEIESFPNEVLNLFLLRLLALGHVPELPPSISNLQYLETLIINDAKDDSFCSSSFIALPRILCLPFEIWTISGLRHIVSLCCGALPSPNKEENSPLQNLETLSYVMNPDCSKDLIEMIPNVKKLGIFYFGVERATHSIENIERLSRLEKLSLCVLVPFSAPQILNLGFPNTLRKLALSGIRLSHRDMLIIGGLPRLRLLQLRCNDFEGDEWRVTPTHGFEMLEFLLLEELGLRHWLRHSGNGIVFPMLKRLVIRACNGLNEVEEVVEKIPSLESIRVLRCSNKSLVESVRRIKQSNESITVIIRK